MSGQSAFMQDTYIKLENAYPGYANKFILSQAAIALFSVIVTIVVIIKVASSDKMQAMEPIETLNRLLMFMFLISAIVVAQVFLFYHPPLRSGAKYTLLPVFG